MIVPEDPGISPQAAVSDGCRPGALRLQHVALSVADLGACERFYCEILGMRVLWRPDEQNVYLTNAADNLALHQTSEGEGAARESLDHIGFVYREHLRYMDHWRAVTDVPILDLSYETLVADLEGESRRLAEFLDVPWDPACLDFHAQDRVALTLSYDQVREPINDRSIGRAARFGACLDPLRTALGDVVHERG